jgi:iron complex transport system substrate-binding protein
MAVPTANQHRLATARWALTLAIAFAPCATTATEPPARIVSINLCTDELLIALADPQQILALSPYAADPTLSTFAERARSFRHDADRAETVVSLKPDVVIGGPFSRLATREMVDRLGYRYVDVAPAASVAETIAEIGAVARLVGHPERGEALIARIETARRRAIESVAAFSSRPTAVFYQRRGFVNGGATLTAELLADLGVTDAGRALAGEAGGFVPLERLVVAHPDFLVVSSESAHAEDQGTALLAHPALATLYPPERRIVLPERFTVCGGPSLPEAYDWLTEEIRRVRGLKG